MITINKEKAYSTKEVAEILKVQTQTVRAHIKRGKLKAIKLGTDYIIPEAYLKKYLEYRSHLNK